MSYVLAMKTNRPAELLPTFARLQGGGFHPFIPNFHHGTIAAGYIIALDGFDILLPKQEIEDAKIWMSDTAALEDYDPIVEKPVGDYLQARVLSMNPLFITYLLPPMLFFCLWAAYVIWFWAGGFGSLLILIFASSSTLCIIGILAHARHIARRKERQFL